MAPGEMDHSMSHVVGMVTGTNTVALMPLPFPYGSDGDSTPRGVGFRFSPFGEDLKSSQKLSIFLVRKSISQRRQMETPRREWWFSYWSCGVEADGEISCFSDGAVARTELSSGPPRTWRLRLSCLSTFVSKWMTGLVMDSGARVLHTVPINEITLCIVPSFVGFGWP